MLLLALAGALALPAPASARGAGSAVSAKALLAQAPGAAPAASARAGGAPPEDPGGFSHRRHRAVQCTSCHLAAQSHGGLKVRTRGDCVACHHGRVQSSGCTRCHDGGKMNGPVGRSVEVRTSVAKAPSSRTLPFAHAFHGSVACRDCHGPAPEYAPPRDCSGCHERHHTEARECQRCHRAEDVKAHPAMKQHETCAGAGCHTDAAVTRLSWSRNVCSACHQDRAQHMPGRECAACHKVPALQTTQKEVAP